MLLLLLLLFYLILEFIRGVAFACKRVGVWVQLLIGIDRLFYFHFLRSEIVQARR